MTTYVVQDTKTTPEAHQIRRVKFSDWVLVGTEKKGNDVESVYRNTASDPAYPTEIRIGVYNKPGPEFTGKTSFSIKMSGWCKITTDDSSVLMVPHSFTLAGVGPYGAVLRATNSMSLLENMLSWLLHLETTPVIRSWTAVDQTMVRSVSNGVTAIDISNMANPPVA